MASREDDCRWMVPWCGQNDSFIPPATNREKSTDEVDVDCANDQTWRFGKSLAHGTALEPP